jgi:hypothetical protein
MLLDCLLDEDLVEYFKMRLLKIDNEESRDMKQHMDMCKKCSARYMQHPEIRDAIQGMFSAISEAAGKAAEDESFSDKTRTSLKRIAEITKDNTENYDEKVKN